MKKMPKVEVFMSAMPHTINPDMPIKVAMEKMRDKQIRHLPVQSGGKLVGILSDRDVKLASTFEGLDDCTVNDVMTADPYSASPSDNLDEVVSAMAEHKYGCAVIQQGDGKIVGIFTATDGLRVLGEVLREQYSEKDH